MMETWDVPPKIKVLEALSAIAGNRVRLKSKTEIEVISSMGDRKYEVIYDPGKNAVFSNDNGSKYRGYLGYPSIVILMLKDRLPFDKELAEALKDVKWKQRNEEYGSYEESIRAVEKDLEEGIDREKVEDFMDKVIDKIKELKLKKLELDKDQKRLESFK